MSYELEKSVQKVGVPILEEVNEVLGQKSFIRKVYSNYDGYMYTVNGLSLGKLEYKNNIYDLDDQTDRRKLLNVLVVDNILEETAIYNGHYLDMQYRFKKECLTTEFIKEQLHKMMLQEKPTVLTFRRLLESIDSKSKEL